jgi:site-specific DNA recombinase
VSIALVKGSDMDLTSAAGRMVVDMLGVADTMESELKAERVARAALQRADEGRASGHVSYGWRRVRTRNANGEVIDWHDEIEPDQAAIVREIVDRLLREESINALVRDFNARGVLPPRAALRVASGEPPGDSKWLPSTIRKLAMRPSNIGKVVRGRKIHGDAAWPPIVDADKHARVVAMLTDPLRVATRGGARKHLLSYGIGECGKCGSVLRVLKRYGHELYVCNAPSGCVGRRREWVDDLVERVIIARLSQPDARDLLVHDDDANGADARERAEGIRARLAEAADAYADGEIDRAQLSRITARLRPELDEAERESTRAIRGVAPELVTQLPGPGAAERWTGLSVTQRRALLTVFGVSVRVLPARGGPGFKPESVAITWRADG